MQLLKEIGYYLKYFINGFSLPEFLLVFGASLILLYCLNRFILKKRYKNACVLALALYVYALLFFSLLSRNSGEMVNSWATLFQTYRLLFAQKNSNMEFDIVFNIAIFIPLGFLPAVNCRKKKNVLLICFVTSLIIELLQLVTGRGYFEIADLINNTIGGLIGIMICSIIQKRSCNAAEKDKIDGE